MTGWWRRNAMALGALAVLAPVTFGAIAWEGWQGHFPYQSSMPVDVVDGETIEMADATWGPVRFSEIDDPEGFDMPPGTRLLAAVIPVEPHGEPPSCLEPTLVQQSSGIRWTQVRYEIGLSYSSEEPTSCVTLPDAEYPYEIIVPFAVPSDAEGPFWVEVAPSDAKPSVIRFPVDP